MEQIQTQEEIVVNKHDGETYNEFVRRQFKKNRIGMVSLYVVIVLACIAIFADFLANEKPLIASYKGEIILPIFKSYFVKLGVTKWDSGMATLDWKNEQFDWAIFPLVPYSMETIDTSIDPNKLSDKQPSSKHWLGTDDIARDILSGILHGSRYALSIGFIAMSIALTIGIILGSVAGYFGGWTDIIISRLIEIILSLPLFFVIITFVALLQDVFIDSKLWLIMAIIGFTNWATIARLIRGEVLRVRSMEYVTASKALGFSDLRVLFLHVLPNAIAPVLVSAAFGIASAVLTESSLSFLGFGVPPTVLTWGSILSRAGNSTAAWWVGVFPGLMMFITVSAYNLIGDALRDATDPRLRS
ncbi:MAG: ABC transporter permease [Candidatus Kapabacteria bacterium]|nr:ABC transporter permease [Candidatus Kapabacteria bacterium]MBX7153857.1 ABC transporter permease [Bacteroidota bacterium]